MILIRAYQILVSPLLPRRCRFTPTCSEFSVEALERLGAAKGGWLAIKRILRCHPGCPGGYDPVPERERGNCGGFLRPARSATPASNASRCFAGWQSVAGGDTAISEE